MEESEFSKGEKRSLAERGHARRRSIMDWGMGILWMGMGIFMVFIRYFDVAFKAQYDDPYMKAFGVICLLYGAFRVYRGVKKNYFTE